MPDQLSQLPRLPAGLPLAEQTRDYAAQLYSAVGNQYLTFRRDFCGDANPSLATLPPRSSAVQQTEGAKIASGTLRVVPRDMRQLPVIRDVLDHLQWEVDIHTLTERERLELHNITMSFLYGVSGGIQPWYVEWQITASHNLQGPLHPDYYLAYPWHGRLYRTPQELATFDRAVAQGDIQGIEGEIGRVGNGLVKVLHDPLGTQPELAFTGPDAERRRAFFNLKTAAGLALGAYLAAEIVHGLVAPHRTPGPPQSVLPPLPAQISTHMQPEENRT